MSKMTRNEAILSGKIEEALRKLFHLKTEKLFNSRYLEKDGRYALSPLFPPRGRDHEEVKAYANGMKLIQDIMGEANVWDKKSPKNNVELTCIYTTRDAEGVHTGTSHTNRISDLLKQKNLDVKTFEILVSLPPTQAALDVLQDESQKIKAKEKVLELFQQANVELMERFAPEEHAKVTRALLKQAGIKFRKSNTKTAEI